MRKISEEAYVAFVNKRKFKKGNTEVRIVNGLSQMYLFNNRIAEMNQDGETIISTSGWPSRTTCERLNAFINIRIKKGSLIVRELFKWDGYPLNIDRI